VSGLIQLLGPRTRRALPWLALLALLLALGLLALDPAEAWARVGGGQSYGGSSRSSGGSSSSSGGGSGDLVFFLIWLCIEHPLIGIPVTLVVIAVVVVKIIIKKSRGPRYDQPPPPHSRPARPGPRRRAPGLDPRHIVVADPNFSVPAFLDFAQVVYARCQQERPRELASVAAYLGPQAATALQQRSQAVAEVRDVIFGATRIVRGGVTGAHIELLVHFETNLTEVRVAGNQQLLLTERWTFRKQAGALSPPPERLAALACPSCGTPVETRPDGSCVHCDTPIGAGRALWQVADVRVVSQEPVSPPRLSLGAGQEAGSELPTIFDPLLGAQLRALQTRDPAFQLEAFKAQVRQTFLLLQQAWSDSSWEQARPYETDHLFQSHRYWIERYRRFGLQNKLEQVQLRDIVPVKISTDAFYEAITLRLAASMVDYTVDKQGQVVGGHRSRTRRFTEYWTFIRTAGQHAPRKGDLLHCPACGAPLDKVSQSGVCGYCDAKIASGQHAWVLSAIEQDEAYEG